MRMGYHMMPAAADADGQAGSGSSGLTSKLGILKIARVAQYECKWKIKMFQSLFKTRLNHDLKNETSDQTGFHPCTHLPFAPDNSIRF